MKTSISIVAFLLLTFALEAQQPETKTLFREIRSEYAISDLYFYTFNYGNKPMNGASVNVSGVFKNNFATGLSIDITQSKNITFPNLNIAVTPRFTYYGFSGNVEYLIMPHKFINFSIPLKVGMGYATYNDYYYPEQFNYYGYSTTYRQIADDAFFIVEPGLKVMVNLFKSISLSAGANYRLALGVNTIGNNANFSGLTFNTGLQFKINE